MKEEGGGWFTALTGVWMWMFLRKRLESRKKKDLGERAKAQGMRQETSGDHLLRQVALKD